MQPLNWHQVHHLLRADIESGAFPDGTLLPPQHELAARFGVGRHTLRRALAALRNEGHIAGGQGGRARVVLERIHLPVSLRTRFSVSTEHLGLPASARLISRRQRVPSAEVARMLGLSRLTAVPVAVILRKVGDLPVSLSSHYFAPALVKRLSDIPETRPSITRTLSELGITDYLRRQTLVTARFPTESEAINLEVRRHEPVLSVIGQNVMMDGAPLEVSVSVFRSDKVDLRFVFQDT
jgi:GntR family transcriptional regulator, phosphonate transport system regulatory protein